jgi:acyl dehydratase
MTIFESVRAGTELPASVHVTTTAQLVKYAGAANDYSGIHYDQEYARERGFPGVIVHGFLKAGLLASLATEWAGDGAWLSSFSARYVGLDVVGAPIVCRGRVDDVAADRTSVTLELWTENADGAVTTRARGVLRAERTHL